MNFEKTYTGLYIIPDEMISTRGNLQNGRRRSTCPFCRDTRHHPNNPSFAFNEVTGIGICFHCGAVGILKSKYDKWLEENEKYRPTEAYKIPKLDHLMEICSPEALTFIRDRGLSAETMKILGVKETDIIFEKGEQPERALAYVSYENGIPRNIQYRSVNGKRFRMETGCSMPPYNIDACLSSDTVFITEGHNDVAALIEAGHPNVISVGNGANTKLDNWDRFQYSHFAHIKMFYIAGDNDTEGLKLREALIKYFRPVRCRIVEWRWPKDDGFETAKDANECLMKGGKEAVEYCIANMTKCPNKNIIRASDTLELQKQYWKFGLPKSETIGLGDFDKYCRFQKGRFYLLTGQPGSGKSTFADFILARLLYGSGWRSLIYSPEKYPVARHYRELIQTLTARKCDKSTMTEAMLDRANNYLNENIIHVISKSLEINEILNTAEQEIEEDHIDMLVVDPFNFIELPQIPGTTDADKITIVLKRIAEFAHEKNIALMLVAHPKKPVFTSGGTPVPLNLYDISGSANFYNMCDVGIIMERSIDKDVTFLRVLKARFDDLGDIGTAYTYFDKETFRFGVAVPKQISSTEVQYVHYNKSKDSWLPSVDGEEQLLDFENSPSTEEEDECPF